MNTPRDIMSMLGDTLSTLEGPKYIGRSISVFR